MSTRTPRELAHRAGAGLEVVLLLAGRPDTSARAGDRHEIGWSSSSRSSAAKRSTRSTTRTRTPPALGDRAPTLYRPGSSMDIGTQIAGYRIEELDRPRRHGRRLPRQTSAWSARRAQAARAGARPRTALPGALPRRVAAGRQLDHPNIVPVYEAGEVEGQLYLAMRYVEGTDLKRLLREEGPPSRRGRSPSARQVANALDAAHARGLVHRDVKPANVLLDEQRARLPGRLRPDDDGSRAGTRASKPAPSSARPPTWPPSRSRARRSTAGPTSTRSPACSTSA